MPRLDVDWLKVAVHVVVVVVVLGFLIRPGSPGARGIAAVTGGLAGLAAGAVA